MLTGKANYDAGGMRVLFNLGDEPRWFKFKLGKAKSAKVRIARFMCALLLGHCCLHCCLLALLAWGNCIMGKLHCSSWGQLAVTAALPPCPLPGRRCCSRRRRPS
jgi:hypothetical protein